MFVKCAECGDHIIFNRENLMRVVGAWSTVTASSLQGALIELSIAAWGGNRDVTSLPRLKRHLMEAQILGPFFHCAHCGRAASVA